MADADPLRWLTLVVRSSYDPSARAPLARAAARLNWAHLLALAARHRVEGLAWDGVSQADVSVPADVAATWRRRAERSAAIQLRHSVTVAKLADRFAAAGIDVLFLKGAALAAIAYPRPVAKDSCDIDLLVQPVDIVRAASLLGSLGYRNSVPGPDRALWQWHRRRKESVWLNPDTDVQIDLHSRLTDNPALIPAIGMSSARREVAVAGRMISTLSDAPQFAYLCAHGASSAWFRLKWLADLHAFILANGAHCVDHWHAEAVLAGVGRTSVLALQLLRDWFDFDSPVAASRCGRLTEIALALCRDQLTNPHEPTERRFGTLTIHLMQMLQGHGPSFAAHEAIRQTMDLIRR